MAVSWTDLTNMWWNGGSIFGAPAGRPQWSPVSYTDCKAKCVADQRCVAIASSVDPLVGECWGFAFGKVAQPRTGDDAYNVAYVESRVTTAAAAGVGDVTFTTDAMSEFGNGCCRKRTVDADGKVKVGPPGSIIAFSTYDSADVCKKTCLSMPNCHSFDIVFPTAGFGQVKCWFFDERPDRVLCNAEQRCYKREEQIVTYDLTPLLAGNGHTLTDVRGRYKYVFNVGQDLDSTPDSSCQATDSWDPLTATYTNVTNGGSYAMAYQFPTYQDSNKPWCHRIAGSAYDSILPALSGGKPQYIGCRDTLPLGAATGEVTDITDAVYVHSPSECALKCKARGLQFMMLECPNPQGVECRCLGESAIGKIPSDGDCSGAPTFQLPGNPVTGIGGEPGSASNDHTDVGQGKCSGFKSSFTYGDETTAQGNAFALGGWHRGALYALRSNHKWSLIDDTNPHRGVVLEMEGGDVCKGKGGAHPRATAARSLRIEFQCEANTEPLPQFEQVSEDNFCEYSFTMQTIHGCPTQCAKTNGKICNDIGKCAWDHDEESVRCACSQDSGLSEEAAVAISGQHDTHFGPLFISFV